METAAIVVTAVIILTFFLPVQKKVIAEGVFGHERIEFNFRSDRNDRIWYFRYPCSHCWISSRTKYDQLFFRELCPVVVPRWSLNLSGVTPKPGNSLAITGGANIFGRLIFFRIIPTNYKDEFVKKELLEPGVDFYMREQCVATMKERYNRYVHNVWGRRAECLKLDDVATAERESFTHKGELYDYLPQFLKEHTDACDWCKKLLLRDEESLREIEKLKADAPKIDEMLRKMLEQKGE